MSTGNAAWIGRKGRSSTNTQARSKSIATPTKHAPYACSNLFDELNSVVGKFTVRQKELAEATGFHAFSKPVHDIQFDRQFTTWLLAKVDTMNRSISVSPGQRLMIFEEDASIVFGLPISGKQVWDASLDKTETMRKKIQCMIGMDVSSHSTRDAAFGTLRALAGKELTEEEEEEEEDVFKVAFTIFVVSMLCDSKNPGDVDSVNFWPALANPADIHKFNWASYVLDAVFSACAAAKMATRKNLFYMPPAGSALFLQIFYLDNMDYGVLSLPEDSRPRMQLFDGRTLSKHILAETIGLRGQTPCRLFGAGKVRPADQVMYRREVRTATVKPSKISSGAAHQKRARPESSAKGFAQLPATQKLDVKMQTILAVKAHKTRCLKIITLARKSIEEETEKLVQAITDMKFEPTHSESPEVTVLEEATVLERSPGEPFTPSPTNSDAKESTSASGVGNFVACDPPSFSLGPEFEDNQTSEPAPNSIPINSPISSLGPSPPRKAMRRSSPSQSPLASTKQKSGEFLFNKRTSGEINLNDLVAELEFTQSPVTRKVVKDTSWAFSQRKKQAANMFHSWAIGSVADPNRFWLRHGSPKFIELSAAQIIAQFGKDGSLEPDTCDAILRRFGQAAGKPSWRHYLETDFAIRFTFIHMRIIADEDYISSRSILHQWVGKHITHDVSKCMLIMTLVMVENKWTAYAWDMKRRQLTIYAAGNSSCQWDPYDKIASLLNAALRICIENFFDGWVVDWGNWATVYTTAPVPHASTPIRYDFAAEALQFCRTFDGVKQGGRLTAINKDCATLADLLYDMLHLQGNTGKLPSQFVQEIEE